MSYLTELLAILGVVFPASFWAIRVFIINTVKTIVDSVFIEEFQETKQELASISEDLQLTKENQQKFHSDIEWIKSILNRMESYIMRDKD